MFLYISYSYCVIIGYKQKKESREDMKGAYDVHEVADFLEISVQSVRKYIKEGKLKAVLIANKHVISERNYQKFIDGDW